MTPARIAGRSNHVKAPNQMNSLRDAKHISSYTTDMNKLPVAKRVPILSMLCEGSSMRSISRVADVSINTVAKLLAEAGTACAGFHDRTVRNVGARKVQSDEIWSFCYAKQRNVKTATAAPEGAGDVWTWTAIDSESKLIVSWLVGGRDAGCATDFIADLKGRLSNRVQITTDGHKAYLEAVEGAFGNDVDYAMLVKLYGEGPTGPERKYNPSICLGARKDVVTGDPDIDHISTSHVECQNLTMRMSMRRFTRLTNAFSRKLESHYHALALYFVFYNFVKMHKTLKATPALVAGVTNKRWTMEDIVALIDADAPKPGPRGPYKKRSAQPGISK